MAKKEKMIRRVVMQGITVVREGKRTSPDMHKPFDFTEQEIEYLDRVAPGATRNTVNEAVAEPAVVEDQPEEPKAETQPAATKTPKRGKAAKKAPAKAEEPESSESDEEEAGDADESEDDDI